MTAWHSTDRLTLDREGIVWEWLDDTPPRGYRRLGRIEDVAGDLAEQLAGELAELLDLWEDAFDDGAEQLWDYVLSRRI